MRSKGINIVSFNVPSPPDYGGVIDVYYKVKALADAGARVALHCYEFNRPRDPQLERMCESVTYYPRRTGLLANLSTLPYNVRSRSDSALVPNLLRNDHPILYDTLATCASIRDPRLDGRLKIYRESNIEHDYFRYLAAAEPSLLKKAYYMVEAARYRAFEPAVAAADLALVVSQADGDDLRRRYPSLRVEFLPSFSGFQLMEPSADDLPIVLYHANLSVPENAKAALYLMREVFPGVKARCVVAGMNPSPALVRAAAAVPNVELVASPSQQQMQSLISGARVAILTTHQPTGLKLKLLGSLFAGKHVVVNTHMVHGSGLAPLCTIADTAQEQIEACNRLIATPFTADMLHHRREKLMAEYSNEHLVARMLQLIGECGG